MAHTHDEVLAAVKADFYPQANDVAQIYPDNDLEWWVVDDGHNTFAIAWYDESDILNARPYHP
jgi:hypothetical protein